MIRFQSCSTKNGLALVLDTPPKVQYVSVLFLLSGF